MNNDLISKSHFDKRVREAVGMTIAELTADFKDGVRTTLELLKTEQTVDAVPVVQCKDCKHRRHDGYCTILLKNVSGVASQWFVPADDWYCANGERLEEDDLPMCANHYGERREDDE